MMVTMRVIVLVVVMVMMTIFSYYVKFAALLLPYSSPHALLATNYQVVCVSVSIAGGMRKMSTTFSDCRCYAIQKESLFVLIERRVAR